MRIYELTAPELNRYREKCNFLDDEMIYFEMRSQRKSNIQIAQRLSVSESQVSKIARRVKQKMNRLDVNDTHM